MVSMVIFIVYKVVFEKAEYMFYNKDIQGYSFKNLHIQDRKRVKLL